MPALWKLEVNGVKYSHIDLILKSADREKKWL